MSQNQCPEAGQVDPMSKCPLLLFKQKKEEKQDWLRPVSKTAPSVLLSKIRNGGLNVLRELVCQMCI
jgi:hypothetical protein